MKSGFFSLDEVSNHILTITNVGKYGADAFTAIVNPPLVAILTVGCIADNVLLVDGQPPFGRS